MTEKIREGGSRGGNGGEKRIQNGWDKGQGVVVIKKPIQPPPARPVKKEE